MLYLVSYDLMKEGQQYEKIIDRLKALGATKCLYSEWFLPSKASASDIRDDLRRYIDNNDRLLVVELKNHAAWHNLLISDEAVLNLFRQHAT